MLELDELFGLAGQGEQLLFHYTSPKGLALMLTSGTYRLSRAIDCNDPRERKEFLFGVEYDAESSNLETPSWAEMDEFAATVNRLLRDGTYFGCFTAEGTAISFDGDFTRGYGRARSWSQYGANHAGACLILDRVQLLKSAVEWVEQNGLPVGSLRHGPMYYVDQPIREVGDRDFAVHLSDFRRLGAEGVADVWFENYWNKLFLEKALDWQSEQEYRIVIRSGPLRPRLPLGASLLALAVGEDYPEEEYAVLRHRLREAELDQIHVARIRWFNGGPLAYPDRLFEEGPI